MNKKTLIVLTLSAAVAVSALAGCSGGNPESSSSETTAAQSTSASGTGTDYTAGSQTVLGFGNGCAFIEQRLLDSSGNDAGFQVFSEDDNSGTRTILFSSTAGVDPDFVAGGKVYAIKQYDSGVYIKYGTYIPDTGTYNMSGVCITESAGERFFLGTDDFIAFTDGAIYYNQALDNGELILVICDLNTQGTDLIPNVYGRMETDDHIYLCGYVDNTSRNKLAPGAKLFNLYLRGKETLTNVILVDANRLPLFDRQIGRISYDTGYGLDGLSFSVNVADAEGITFYQANYTSDIDGGNIKMVGEQRY